jgi:hypothetical protein
MMIHPIVTYYLATAKVDEFRRNAERYRRRRRVESQPGKQEVKRVQGVV